LPCSPDDLQACQQANQTKLENPLHPYIPPWLKLPRVRGCNNVTIKSAELVSSSYNVLQLAAAQQQAQQRPGRQLPEIAVVGRSNVGKSSLINYLVGTQQLAKVSKQPGN
jgi:ribosome biogenesis GTPase A